MLHAIYFLTISMALLEELGQIDLVDKLNSPLISTKSC